MLQELINKLEAATEGSRELDGDIYAVLGYSKGLYRFDASSFGCDVYAWHWAPYYTTLLDAAVSLVPKEFGWSILSLPESKSEAVIYTLGTNLDHIVKEATTPSLALCIAALCAHLVMDSKPDIEHHYTKDDDYDELDVGVPGE